MSDGPRIPLKTAQRIAEDIQAMLAPSCQRIVVAGSSRREKVDAGDIEMVIEPRYSSMVYVPPPQRRVESYKAARYAWLKEHTQ